MIRSCTATALLLAAPAALAAEEEARETRSHLARIRSALERHEGEVGQLPRNVVELGAVLRAYAPRVPQRGGRALDGWGRPFRYAPDDASDDAPDASGFALYSVGADGVDEGGAGDDLGRGPASEEPRLPPSGRRALHLLPLLLLAALAPVVWALLRWMRRRYS